MKINLLNPQEVSQILNVDTATLAVWRCTKRYNLPYVKIGGRVRYKMEDILTFVEERTEGGFENV